jgi:uncharacterized protein YciU (UPF0263 family)
VEFGEIYELIIDDWEDDFAVDYFSIDGLQEFRARRAFRLVREPQEEAQHFFAKILIFRRQRLGLTT